MGWTEQEFLSQDFAFLNSLAFLIGERRKNASRSN